MTDKGNFTVIVGNSNLELRELYVKKLQKYGFIIVDSTGSGKRLLSSYVNHKPDLLYLDVELDKLDGITVCKNLLDHGYSPAIIFCTNSTIAEHYSKAFELGAIDYVPMTTELTRFEVAMNRAMQYLTQQRAYPKGVPGEFNIVRKFIRFKQKYRDHYLNEDQILFLRKTSSRLCELTLSDGSVMETNSSIKELLQQCTEHLFSPHRSFLINIKYIASITPDPMTEGNYEISLIGSQYRIPLTRRSFGILSNQILNQEFDKALR